MMIRNILTGITSILLGGTIYLLWRDQNLFMFSWFDALGLSSPIMIMRDIVVPYSKEIPDWFCFSLPNALWAFGGILFFSEIWRNLPIERFLWISLFSIIAVGSELGQLVKLVPGTYDNYDFVLMLIFIALATMIIINDVSREASDGKNS